MATRGDAPDRQLVCWTWAVAAVSIATAAWNGAIDNRDVGDPASSIAHELASDAPFGLALLGFVAIGAAGLARSGGARRTRAAFALVALSALALLGGLAWSFVEDVTTDHQDGGEGLVLVGLAGCVVAVAWLTVLWRRRDRVERPPSGRADEIRRRWGASAYLGVFGSLTVLALLPLAVSSDVPTVVAVVIITCAVLAWLAARAIAAAPATAGGVAAGAVRPEDPTDSATREYLAPAGEGRLARSWRLTRAAGGVLVRDRTLLALALLSVLISALATFGILWATGWFRHPVHARSVVWVSLAAAWPLSFVATFFNVALVAAAAAAFEGRRLGLGAALAVSVRRIGQIVLWSLLASAVGAILRVLAERLPFGGRIASGVLGAGWSVVTLFAVPVLAVEGCTATACVARSSQLIRRRWGEGIGGAVIISAWAVLASIPAGMLIGAAVNLHGAARATLLAIGFGVLVLIGGANGATRQVFALALYRYAASGDAPAAFAAEDLDHPFSARRRWFRA